MLRRLNDLGQIRSGTPPPSGPASRAACFHNDFSTMTVAVHASAIHRTKVPVHASKVLRSLPEIVS